MRGGVLRIAGVDVPLDGRGPAREGAVIAGVRPPDLAPIAPGDEAGLPRIRATLEVVERLGSESHVIFPVDASRLEGEAAAAADEATEERDATLLAEDARARFTARIEGRRRFSPGETVEFTLRPDTLHLFDPDTGTALR